MTRQALLSAQAHLPSRGVIVVRVSVHASLRSHMWRTNLAVWHALHCIASCKQLLAGKQQMLALSVVSQ
jgi:hypothetical protein